MSIDEGVQMPQSYAHLVSGKCISVNPCVRNKDFNSEFLLLLPGDTRLLVDASESVSITRSLSKRRLYS